METAHREIVPELTEAPDSSRPIADRIGHVPSVVEAAPSIRRAYRSVIARSNDRRRRPRKPFIYRHSRAEYFLQRLRDVVLASLGLLALSPLLLVAAIAIRLEDGGPVVFTQLRVGRFERLFTIYKLRTMRTALCGDGVSPTSGGDARITNVGRILRKTSIDEIPQLFNIIRGDMTLVGPRPEMPFIVRRYARWQHLRHLETPGLTGLWQISYRSTVPLEKFEATAVDLEYIDRSSPSYDLSLILRTFSALVRSKGAY